MSKEREFVHSLGHNKEFYRKEIQAVLQRWADRLPPEHIFQTFLALSPLAVMVPPVAPISGEGPRVVLELYFKGRTFFAELLLALDVVWRTPADPKSISDVAVWMNGTVASSFHDKRHVSGTLQHQELADYLTEMMGRKVKVGAVKMALKREKDRRAAIDKKWRKIFERGKDRDAPGNKKRGKA